jgi:ferric-dicitrate binding protein FerR (iron transport regulator)
LAAVDNAWQHIQTRINTPKRKILRPWMAAAAIILLISGILIYNLINPFRPLLSPAYANDISPGKNQATLTLSDGRKIPLDDQHKGFLATDANATIRKTRAGEIIYDASPETSTNAVNSMATPSGGAYELKLADGTLAVLDAASSIEYPVTFSGKERKVKITGQVYFEVSHDAQKPFMVTFNDNVVEVLGTHFNINTYSDEPEVKTTLLQGSVLMKSNNAQVLLKPGEQAILKPWDGSLKVATVNTRNEVSWKDNYFRFEKENIKEIMRQLARWYAIEVAYEGPVTDEEFSGVISRTKNISQVLRMLEYSQSVHFKIAGRRVIVMR